MLAELQVPGLGLERCWGKSFVVAALWLLSPVDKFSAISIEDNIRTATGRASGLRKKRNIMVVKVTRNGPVWQKQRADSTSLMAVRVHCLSRGSRTYDRSAQDAGSLVWILPKREVKTVLPANSPARRW
jgi:hypothetical protein